MRFKNLLPHKYFLIKLLQIIIRIRLQWSENEVPCIASLVLETLLGCPKLRLKRLVLCQRYHNKNFKPVVTLPVAFLFEFAERMKHMVAFGLLVAIESEIAKEVECRFLNEILPKRPAFWFHLKPFFPCKTKVPRVHHDVVFPIKYYEIPPKFPM